MTATLSVDTPARSPGTPAAAGVPASTTAPAAAAPAAGLGTGARRAVTALRVGTGAVFLWAFADKLVGLGYATPSERAWVHGGSPTRGFLSHVEVGPLQGLMHAMAGTWYADTLFMAGLLGIGLAAVLGFALRPAAVAGTALLALMWAAEWPLAQHTSAGAPSGSTNPLVDYHVVYALALVAVAALPRTATAAARLWQRLPVVRDHGWLR